MSDNHHLWERAVTWGEHPMVATRSLGEYGKCGNAPRILMDHMTMHLVRHMSSGTGGATAGAHPDAMAMLTTIVPRMTAEIPGAAGLGGAEDEAGASRRADANRMGRPQCATTAGHEAPFGGYPARCRGNPGRGEGLTHHQAA
jgi:hypothetical protein